MINIELTFDTMRMDKLPTLLPRGKRSSERSEEYQYLEVSLGKRRLRRCSQLREKEKSGVSKWMKVTQACPTLATPWTVARQTPLSMGFKEYLSGLPFPSPGDLPYPGIEPKSPHCRQILYQAMREAPQIRRCCSHKHTEEAKPH